MSYNPHVWHKPRRRCFRCADRRIRRRSVFLLGRAWAGRSCGCVSGPGFRSDCFRACLSRTLAEVVLAERRRIGLGPRRAARLASERPSLRAQAAAISSGEPLHREEASLRHEIPGRSRSPGEAAGVLDDDRAQPIRCPGNTCNCENSLKKTSGLVVAVKLDKHRVRTRAAAVV